VNIKKVTSLEKIGEKPPVFISCVFKKEVFLQNNRPRHNREHEQQQQNTLSHTARIQHHAGHTQSIFRYSFLHGKPN
jgi:hypothetical protein